MSIVNDKEKPDNTDKATTSEKECLPSENHSLELSHPSNTLLHPPGTSVIITSILTPIQVTDGSLLSLAIRSPKQRKKYHLIKKSPLKGSPVKTVSHILRKHRNSKRNNICLSRRKLQFRPILPKVSKLHPRKIRLLKCKPLPVSLPVLPPALPTVECLQENSTPSQNLHTPILTESENVDQVAPDLSPSNLLKETTEEEKECSAVDNEDENEDEDNDQTGSDEYLAALLKASSTIARDRGTSSSSSKGRGLTKQQRYIHHLLHALSPTSEPDTQHHHELVTMYLSKVRVALALSGQLSAFVSALDSIATRKHSVEEAFPEVMKVLKGHLELQQGFVMFLQPDQAIRLGKYDQYCALTALINFALELKYQFSSHPQSVQKVIRLLRGMMAQDDVMSWDHVVETLRPVFRPYPWLWDDFVQCFSWAKPSQSFSEDFEDIKLDAVSANNCEEFDDFENISLVEDESRSSVAVGKCHCSCHNIDSKALCISCSMRFLDGRMYLQWGKIMRPAKVIIESAGSDLDVGAPMERAGGTKRVVSAPKGGGQVAEKVKKGRKTKVS